MPSNISSQFDDELMHYGVLGMKWGVRKAYRKANSEFRLSKKALNYDKKSAKLTKKSEHFHDTNDLGSRNRAAKKMAKYRVKEAQVAKKVLKTDDEAKRLRYEQKAAKYEYKAAKKQIDANRISKITGYGVKAMTYSVKSDRAAKKAAKVRLKLANNQRYIDMTKRRVNDVASDPKYQETIAELRKKYGSILG